MINWHHLFGWTLMDYFMGSNYKVELEKDLSVKPQFLDVIILEQMSGTSLSELPDGLEDLSQHNLLTYKSLRETLDALVIFELLSHYINYRKILDPDNWNNLPLSNFRLYAVTTRYPQKLRQQFKNRIRKQKAGVYDLKVGDHTVRVIVLNEMPKIQKNALWQLFGIDPLSFEFGSEHYQWRYPPAIALLNPLYKLYEMEGINMPYTLEEACLICARDTLESLPPDERLRGLPPDERLRGLPLPEIIKHFSSTEVLKQFSPTELLKELSVQEIEEYLAQLKAQQS